MTLCICSLSYNRRLEFPFGSEKPLNHTPSKGLQHYIFFGWVRHRIHCSRQDLKAAGANGQYGRGRSWANIPVSLPRIQPFGAVCSLESDGRQELARA